MIQLHRIEIALIDQTPAVDHKLLGVTEGVDGLAPWREADDQQQRDCDQRSDSRTSQTAQWF